MEKMNFEQAPTDEGGTQAAGSAAVALHDRALARWSEGQRTSALALMEQAVQLLPESSPVLSAVLISWAEMRRMAGDGLGALATFQRVLTREPGRAEIWNAAGACYQETGNPAKAMEYYLRALMLQPRFPEALSNMGVVLLREGDTAGAIDHLEQALALRPAFPEALNNLGLAYRARLEYPQARAAFERSLALDGENVETLAAAGELLSLIYGNHAETLLRRAVEREPENPERHWNWALELLKRGDYEAGFREYEWRLQRPVERRLMAALREPLWRPLPAEVREWVREGTLALRGRRLLLHAEQGFGDTLQMLRYLPQVHGLGADIVLEVQAPLLRLAQAFAERTMASGPAPLGAIQVLAAGAPRPACDEHLPLMSLPFTFGTTLETVPPPLRLSAEAAPRRRAPGDPLRVGLAWAGNPEHGRDRERSLPVQALAELLRVDGVRWVNLQVGPAAAALAPVATAAGVAFEQPRLQDFADTAAAMEELDVVIAADTAVAHLAGSQAAGGAGGPGQIWLLLPFVADWRWGRPADTVEKRTPWYPEARVFRQTVLEREPAGAAAWRSVLQAVAAALDGLR